MESLLSITQGLIERTYATATGIDDIAPFVIGDRGYQQLVARHTVVRSIENPDVDVPLDQGDEPAPQVLIRPLDDGAALAVYFPDEMISRLECQPPTQTLHAGNVDDFAWQDEGDLLAATLLTAWGTSNGVVLFDPDAGTLRTLDSRDATYRALTWRDESAQLAVLRSVESDDHEDETHDVLVWGDVRSGGLPDLLEGMGRTDRTWYLRFAQLIISLVSPKRENG